MHPHATPVHQRQYGQVQKPPVVRMPSGDGCPHRVQRVRLFRVIQIPRYSLTYYVFVERNVKYLISREVQAKMHAEGPFTRGPLTPGPEFDWYIT